jgi:hypothetical protein
MKFEDDSEAASERSSSLKPRPSGESGNVLSYPEAYGTSSSDSSSAETSTADQAISHSNRNHCPYRSSRSVNIIAGQQEADCGYLAVSSLLSQRYGKGRKP